MGTLTFLPMEAGTGSASPARHRFNENQVAQPRANSDQAGGGQP